MKKIQIVLALGMTVPMILAFTYCLFMYGNFSGSTGMGGLEVALFLLYIALPIAAVCFLISISRMIYLKVKHLPRRQEIKYFLVTLLVSGIIGFIVWELNKYCFVNACDFLPARFGPEV